MVNRKLIAAVARIAVLGLLGLIATGCSSTEETPSSSVAETAAPSQAGDPGDGADAGGDTGIAADSLPFTEELNGRRLTVESFGTSTPASPLWEVGEGNEVLYLQVKIENVDADPWESNVVQFFLFDESDETYGPSFYDAEVGDAPDAVTLAPGEAVEGYVPFEVPAGTTGLRLEYAVDLSQNAVIDVQLN
ncbi:DUF4352 domain-containing protein [Solwaraspora sp. WMMD406]|uniref:DUF4352 domain-containing protein n=1 Tax=Solwaraspora sp. WMMD406 TaxID=3016095 RepID=UPI002416942B|nr:DUF4352 domain-containing protein [Solwaraspora sp. WMMD406]MDG4766559.1 DUF4352 domain-containing protein [Solwaraspora sp. WMMD406]